MNRLDQKQRLADCHLDKQAETIAWLGGEAQKGRQVA